MNIVIVGVGKLGKILTKHLLDEKHDITIIDKNASRIEEMVNELDVVGYCGNGASYQTQLNAYVNKSDILIATTPSDELNILCCLVAKKLGVKQTIARVRNPEYEKQVSIMHDELGISMTINPERDSATEISRMLQFPGALKVETFAKGKVSLIEIKLEKGSPLHNRTLVSLREKYNTILVCAVQRGNEVFIPKGDFVLQENDNIYITAESKDITNLLKNLNILTEKTKSTMIIGGGKISYYLAEKLIKAGIYVKIIETDYQRCVELNDTLPKAMIIHADGTNNSVLLEEGIQNMDSLVTLTGMDEANIIISTFAKSYCDKVVTKVNNSNYAPILKKIGLDSVFSPKEISSNNVIRYIRGVSSVSKGSEFKTLYRLVENKIEAIEFLISEENEYTNIPIKDLKIKNNVLLSCIIRKDEIIIPQGKDVIMPYDTIIIVAANSTISDVANIFE